MLIATKLAPDNEVFMNAINHYLRSFQSIMIQTFSEVYFKELQETGRPQVQHEQKLCPYWRYLLLYKSCCSIPKLIVFYISGSYRYQSRQ